METKQSSKNQKFREFSRKLSSIPILLICIFETIGLFLLPSAFSGETSLKFGFW